MSAWACARVREGGGAATFQPRHSVRNKCRDIDPGWADTRCGGRARGQKIVAKGGRQQEGELAHAAGKGEDGVGLVVENHIGAVGKTRAVDRADAQLLLQVDQPLAEVGMGEGVGLTDMVDDLRIRRSSESRLRQIDQPGQGQRLTSMPTAHDGGAPEIVTEWMMYRPPLLPMAKPSNPLWKLVSVASITIRPSTATVIRPSRPRFQSMA